MDNVDLLITSLAEARVTHSPQGRSPAPAPVSHLRSLLSTPPPALDTISIAQLQALGASLFDTLAADTGLRDLLVANFTAASLAAGLLRLRLQIDPPELRGLPWEALYRDPGGFLALGGLSIVRYVAIGLSLSRPVVTQLPLKLLVASASPSELPRLNFDSERRNLTDALADEIARGWVKVTFVEHARRQSVRDALIAFRPHVFHFSGHGSFKNDRASLAFEDTYGDTDPIAADDVALLFGGLPELRLVVLNACESAVESTAQPLTGIAPKILQQAGVPAVVAMQAPILDRAAIAFSGTFYNALALGLTIDESLREGRLAIYNAAASAGYFAAPVLFLSTDAGVLVEFPQQRRERIVAQARRGLEDVRAGPADELTTASLNRWQVNLGLAARFYKKLAAWKSLHDILHDLNEALEFVSLEIPRVDKADPDLTFIADHWARCQTFVRHLTDFARREAADAADASIVTQPYSDTGPALVGDPWIVEVVSASRAFESALGEANLKSIAGAARKLRQVSHTHMNASDKRIQDLAAELRRLSDRWTEPKTLPVNPELAAAVTELDRLHALLFAAVEKHQGFQDLDNDYARLRDEVRRSADRGYDWDAIAMAWAFCRSDVLDSRLIPFAKRTGELMIQNGDITGADWAVEVVRLAGHLDRHVAAEDEAAVRTTVRNFGTAIRTHFYVADKELKEITETLDALSDDLLAMLAAP